MLDAAMLAAITQEARQAFLDEDAPECLAMLTQGFGQLEQAMASQTTTADQKPIFKNMGRAAHSLKGGAGMAELPSLNRLCHKMEDLFEALELGRIDDTSKALGLLSLALDEVQVLVDEAIAGGLDSADRPPSEINLALEEFITSSKAAEEGEVNLGDVSDFVRTALATELESCLDRVEQQIKKGITEPKLKDSFNHLLEECTLLGQALSCDWLETLSQQSLELQSQQPLTQLVPTAIGEVRNLREQFLAGHPPTLSPEFQALLPQPAPVEVVEIPALQVEEPPKPAVIAPPPPVTDPSQRRQSLRVPLQRLTRMSSTVSQLLINHERLLVYDKQLRQASRNLKTRNQQLVPIREQVESLYDELSFSEQALPNVQGQNSAESPLDDFDALEFDRYGSVHTILQRFQEVMVQVQEIQEDVETVERELQETLIEVRQSLNTLDEELTQSRLLPFGNLARSFGLPLEKLCKTHYKSVQLVIKGESILLELTILEQLRTPLTHLIRNAFDHGIEMPQDRLAAGKPAEGTITLSAAIAGNQITLIIADDGHGINLDKIRQKAVSLGLTTETRSQNAGKEMILDYLFAPGFSTTDTVSDLSGRGLGLDIVRQLIEGGLRGSIRLETDLGKGSRFILRIPLTLNILPLLLIRSQQHLLAVPSESVLRVLPLGEHPIIDNQLEWQGQKLPVYSLAQLLPYHVAMFDARQVRGDKVGLMVNMDEHLSVIPVEKIVDERPLVVKAFEPITNLPNYLGGCTVLGTGEIVPIILPNNFEPQANTPSTITPVKLISSPVIVSSEESDSSILVIDDSITVRRTLNRVLGRSGYRITQCRDGQEAWDLLNRQSDDIDLAICDLEMPNMDGFTLMKLIRSHDVWKTLPIIVLTSRENPLHRQRAQDLGATHYLTKPFQPNNLLETVAEVLTV